MSLNFFDCDFGVGRSGQSIPVPATPADALAVMDRYGIADALVYDRGAHESGVFDRFDFLLEYCSASRRLHPAIPVVPPATGEQPAPAALVDFCRANGIRAVRACPNAHAFQFDRHFWGSLLAVLEKHHMPLFYVSMGLEDHPWMHAPQWQNIREVAAAYPDLPIIVVYTGMLQGRNLFPLLECCPNVLADLTCVSFQFVETVVERFGSHRLVMASHYPQEDPGLYTTWVNYSGVDDAARRAIAGDNVRRLLEAVK